MEGFYINREVGPFITTLDSSSTSVYGNFKDLPIPIPKDDPMLALGINKLDDYNWNDLEHHHIITWSVTIRSSKDGLYYQGIDIISIESRILFEYYEPHSDDPIEYEWEQTIDLKEWRLDLEDVSWQNGGLYISDIEFNFGLETDIKDGTKYKILKLSSAIR